MAREKKAPEEIRAIRRKAALASVEARKKIKETKEPETSVRVYRKDATRLNVVCDRFGMNQKEAFAEVLDAYGV